MPLPPLPPNNTSRYKLQYVTGNIAHELQNRTAVGITAAAASSLFVSVLTAISADLWSLTVTGMTFAPAGSDIFNPVTFTGTTAFGLGSPSLEESIRSLSVVGRTTGGRKVKFLLFGFKGNKTDNMRITPAENANVGNMLGQIAAASSQFFAIDGLKPIYASYVNVDYNDHWQRFIRG